MKKSFLYLLLIPISLFSQNIIWENYSSISNKTEWEAFKSSQNFIDSSVTISDDINSILRSLYPSQSPSQINVKNSESSEEVTAFYYSEYVGESLVNNELVLLRNNEGVWENTNAKISSSNYIDFDDFKITNTAKYIAVIFEENPNSTQEGRNYQLKIYNKDNNNWIDFGIITSQDQFVADEYINGFSFEIYDNVYFERTKPSYRITKLTKNIEQLINDTTLSIGENGMMLNSNFKIIFHNGVFMSNIPEYQIQVFNIKGVLIENENIKKGFYIVSVEDKFGKVFSQKIILN